MENDIPEIKELIQQFSKLYNSDLKKQLQDVTDEVIKVAGNKNLSDDLTLVGLGN